MKKFLSMFLVLTMVVTALMGVMITDVSAVTVVKKSDGVYEITMGEKANSSMGGIGTYKVKGNDDPDFMPLAEVSKVSLLGKEYIYYDFEAVTVNDSSKVSSNYLRFPTNGKPSTTTYTSNSYVNSIPRETFLNDIKDGKYYKLTFYGYSKTGVGESMNLGVNRETSAALTVSLSPAKIKSDAEVPHKIDVIAYGDSTGTYAYETVYVDGVLASGGKSYATSGYNQKNNVNFNNYIPSVGFNKTNVTYTGKAMDYVIENFGARTSKVDVQVLTKEELDSELFVVITPNTGNVSTQTSTARTDDVITGVQDDVDEALVTAVTNTSAGDRVAEIPAKYTTVGSIYTDKANSNVTAVDKVTGEVAKDTAALSDVLLMVNGVYVLPIVTRGIKQDYISMFESAADGGKIDLYSNVYVSELFESNDTNDVLIKDIPVTAVYNATEYTDLAAMTDVPLKDVTFKYNNKTFGVSSYGAISGKLPFNITTDEVVTRIRRSYYTSSKQAETPFGGLVEGFYKFDSEPRSALTFNTGTVMYDKEGYYQINSFPTYNIKTGAANIALNVNESRYFTMNFDMFLPDYDGVNARLGMCPGYYDANGTRIYNVNKFSTLYFVTQQKNYDANTSSSVLLAPNTWNNISIVFDGGDVANGNVKYSVYVNGELTNISNKVITSEYFKVPGAGGYVSFDFFRFYPAQYTSLAIKDNSQWYYGIYTPQNNTVQTDLSIENANVTVDNVNDKIITKNITQEELETLLADTDYNPVYSYSYASASEMSTAYDDIDDKKPAYTTDKDGNYVYTNNKLIDRWVEHAYDSSSENGVKSSGVPDSGNIVRIDYNSETGHYTLTVTKKFADSKTYDGVTTSLEDVIKSKPELRDEVLIGVAVTDSENPDLLPRVYTWVQSGAAVTGLNVNGSGLATLYYQRYGTGTVTGKFILAAFDINKAVVGVKAKDIAELISAGGEGTDLTITNKFDTVPKGTVRFRAFVFDGLSTLKPLVNASDYVDYVSAEN